jgi:hypothetical protein
MFKKAGMHENSRNGQKEFKNLKDAKFILF